MGDFDKLLAEKMKDEEFRKEYEALQPTFAIVQAMIDARRDGHTRKQLSELTGIAEGYISKLENGNANPSIRTLQRLASALGKTLKIEFVSSEN